MSLSKWLPCDFEQCHPLLWGGGILVDHWSTISSFHWHWDNHMIYTQSPHFPRYSIAAYKMIYLENNAFNIFKCLFLNKIYECVTCHQWPLLLTLIPVWTSNYIHYKVWCEITYPFPNFNCGTVEVWKWIGNFIPHFIMDAIIYPCWDWDWSMLLKRATGVNLISKWVDCCQE